MTLNSEATRYNYEDDYRFFYTLMPLQKAIEVMKTHHQWMPDQITYETDLMSPDTQEALEQMGHVLNERNSLGRLMSVLCPTGMNVCIGASDSSSPDGGAVGY